MLVPIEVELKKNGFLRIYTKRIAQKCNNELLVAREIIIIPPLHIIVGLKKHFLGIMMEELEAGRSDGNLLKSSNFTASMKQTE